MHSLVGRIVRWSFIPVIGILALVSSGSLSHAQLAPMRAYSPPGSGPVSIWTDSTFYYVGNSIQYCYQVPYEGYITIYDRQPGGRTTVLDSYLDDGTGDCYNAYITPPTGRECLQLVFNAGGYRRTDEACFNTSY